MAFSSLLNNLRTPFINEITNTAVYWFDSISDPLVHNKNEIDVESSFAVRVG